MKKPAPRRTAKPHVTAGKPTFKKNVGPRAKKNADAAPARPFAPRPSAEAEGKPGFGRGKFDDKPAPGRRPFGDRPPAGRRKFESDEFEQREAPEGRRAMAPRPFITDKPAPGRRTFGDKPGFGDKPSFGRGKFEGKPAFGRGKFEKKTPWSPDRPLDRGASANAPAPIGDDLERPTASERPRRGRKVEPAMDFDDVIYGIHSVEEALRAGEQMKRLYVGNDRERDTIVRELVVRAKEAKIPVIFEDTRFFAKFPYKAHQNIVAIGEPFEYISLDEAIAVRTEKRLIVLLDHLTDPHNVGAILRTAECAGAQAVVLPDRRSAGINATVRKGAAGAASHLPVAKVGNLSAAIRALKAANFTVIGAALDERAVDLIDAPLGDDIALVIGAEGDGLSKLVAKNCDQLVKIPLLGKVESLNASVAAGVLLYEIVRRRLTESD
jgi:23S rRNA (guanosine2251-2'-O)-methyltransferase